MYCNCMSCCYVTLQYTLFFVQCDIRYERGGGQKKSLLWRGLDILWNDTINIGDAHIFTNKCAGNLFQKIQS